MGEAMSLEILQFPPLPPHSSKLAGTVLKVIDKRCKNRNTTNHQLPSLKQGNSPTTIETRLRDLEEWKRDAKTELQLALSSSPSPNKPLSCDSIAGLPALVSRLVEERMDILVTTQPPQPPQPPLTLDGIPGLETFVSRMVEDSVKRRMEVIHRTPDVKALVSQMVEERVQDFLGVVGDRDTAAKEFDKRVENIATSSVQEALTGCEFQDRVDEEVSKRIEVKVLEMMRGGLDKAMGDAVGRDGALKEAIIGEKKMVERMNDVEERLQKAIDGLMGTSWRAIKQSDTVGDDLSKFKVFSASRSQALSQRVEELHTEVTQLRPLAMNLVEALTKFVGGVGNTLQGPALAALTSSFNNAGSSNPGSAMIHSHTPPKGSSTSDFDYGQLFSPPNPIPMADTTSSNPHPSSSDQNVSGTWEWHDVGGSSGGSGLDDAFGVDFALQDSPSQGSSRSEGAQFHFSGRGGKF